MTNVNLFISYSHADEEYLLEIKKYIEDCRFVKIWDDGDILPGKKWDLKIKTSLNNADIVLLLISQSFLKSTYILNTELKEAIDKSERGECWVIPIFTRSCNLDNHPEISDLQGLPKNKIFLSDMREERYSHYVMIMKKINEIVNIIIDNHTDKNIQDEISNNGRNINNAKVIDQLKNRKKIFLSISNSDAGIKRRKDFLYQVEGRVKHENWPYEIIPGIDETHDLYQKNGNDLKDTFTACLNEAIYAIHLISSEKELLDGIEKIQYDLAKKCISNASLYKVIIWLLDPEIKEKLDKEISMNPIITGTDYESIFELIKDLDTEKDKKIKTLSKEFSPEKKIYMFYDFSKDHNSDLRISIKTKIEENENMSVRINIPNQNLEKEKEDLEKCAGALIFYGATDSQWFLMRQAILLDAAHIRSKAICLDDPDIKKKIDRDVIKNEFQTIKGMNELESGVKYFLERI